MLRIAELLWNDANIDHLWASHQVRPIEVEEIVFGLDGEEPEYIVRRDGDNYILSGKTADGRFLVIALEPFAGRRFRPFAARNMTPNERSAYRKRTS